MERTPSNQSVLNTIKPWKIKQINGAEFQLETVNGKESATIYFSVSNEKITQVSVQFSRTAQKTGSGGETWNFVKLAKSAEEAPEYFDDYMELYSDNKNVNKPSSEEEPAFGQIEFEPLKFQYKACSFGGRLCKEGVFKYNLGNVISDKDMPENQIANTKTYFRDITDMTAFCTPMNADYLQFGNYTITAVVVDKLKKQLTFVRDGLEPWVYGKNEFDFQVSR